MKKYNGLLAVMLAVFLTACTGADSRTADGQNGKGSGAWNLFLERWMIQKIRIRCRC